MQENLVFEYAVIRVVPQVEREEFINVGVILYCAKQQFLQTIFHLDEQRLRAFSSQADPAQLCENLRSFDRICKGGAAGGLIGTLDMPSRFRWLTSTRSTVVQCSKVHPGICKDPLTMLETLHAQLVL